MRGIPLALLDVPDAAALLQFLAPFLAIVATVWLLRRFSRWLDRLFPAWEWEKQLGWLNLGAQRRADQILGLLRGLGQLILLAAAAVMPWGAVGLRPASWDGPDAVADAVTRLTVLLSALGLWLVYLGCDLLPRMRRDYERESLRRYRIELEQDAGEGLEGDPLRHGGASKPWGATGPLLPAGGSRSLRPRR